MNFRQLLQDYFTFSRNERKGLIILLIIIFLLAVVNKVMFHFEKTGKTDSVLFDSAKEELGLLNDSVNLHQRPAAVLSKVNPGFVQEDGSYHAERQQPKETATSAPELFPFDPNRASDDDFYRLGFSEKQVISIRKYMKNGVVFRNRDDFFRIKVITVNQREMLADYVLIGQNENTSSENVVLPGQVSVELNSADSILLKQLPGIGDKLSKRIVKYRDLLGGFHSVGQLKEVYGLREETIDGIADKVTVDISKIKKIDLNFADVSELSRHPYLQKDLAKRIVKFRSEKGSIRSLDVLRDSMILNIDDYNRLKPYF